MYSFKWTYEKAFKPMRRLISSPLEPKDILDHYARFTPWNLTLRATSHPRLKARNHCDLRALIGRKGKDSSSPFHTGWWRSKGPKKTPWMKSLHGVLHGRLWIRFHSLPNFSSGPPPRGGPDTNSGRPWFFLVFFQHTNCKSNFITNSKTDKHRHEILSNW